MRKGYLWRGIGLGTREKDLKESRSRELQLKKAVVQRENGCESRAGAMEEEEEDRSGVSRSSLPARSPRVDTLLSVVILFYKSVASLQELHREARLNPLRQDSARQGGKGGAARDEETGENLEESIPGSTEQQALVSLVDVRLRWVH